MANHYYNRTGEPVYKIIGNNGKERDTNLKDAKKLNLVPGFSEISNIPDKGFHFHNWKKKRLLEVIEENSWLLSKTDEDWKNIAIGMSEKKDSEYSEKGSRIHKQLENYFNLDSIEDLEIIQETIKYLNKEHNLLEAKYIPEKSIICSEGYGGCIDLVIEDKTNIFIYDFKTKSVEQPSEKDIWDVYGMQLSAYSNFFKDKRIICRNILISNITGNIYVYEWKEKELSKQFQMFKCLLKYWQLKNDYDSSF